MTALFLQEELKIELMNLFHDFHLPTPKLTEDNEVIKSVLNIFEQELPVRAPDQGDDPYPYIIIKLDTGSAAENEANKVTIRMIIGTFDEAVDTNGHKDVMNIIQKIYARFAETPVLASKYVMLNDEANPFRWALQEERSYPYYFGAIECTFATMAIRRESKYT